MKPWLIALLLVILIIESLLILPWALEQGRKRKKAYQAWLDSLPPALREAHGRNLPRYRAAQALDALVFLLVLGLGVVLVFLTSKRNPELSRELIVWIVMTPIVLGLVFSHHWLLVRTGSTLGMRLLGLSARRQDGRPLTWNDVLVFLGRYHGHARAKVFTLREEDWERLRTEGFWPLEAPGYKR